MGLILKHVVATKAGTFHYRRRIPKDVAEILGKNEFKRLLGSTEREALKNFPRINAEYERVVQDAKRRKAQANGASSPQTPIEIHKEAERLARQLAQTGVLIGGDYLRAGEDSEAADLLRDSFLSRLPVDPETGDPVGGDAVEGRALGLLSSRGNLERPAPTLQDAKRLYVEERIKGDINETAKLNQLNLVMSHMAAASVPASRPLSSLTRDDARDVRDYMLRDLGLSPASVKRYLNTISAVINMGLTEYEVANGKNPFHKLTVKQETAVIDQRSPIPTKTLKAIRERLSCHAGADLWQIWRIVEGTGCRLGEVSGLLVSDVKLDAPIPYINLVNHPHRRLKTAGSVRRVPLVGTALAAAKEAVKDAGENRFLFARYGRARGADRASASLMKHIRTVTDDPKIVVHSLRHTMEDRLIRARVDEFDRNLVLGHSRGGMSERYGGPDARLEAALVAVKAALALPG